MTEDHHGPVLSGPAFSLGKTGWNPYTSASREPTMKDAKATEPQPWAGTLDNSSLARPQRRDTRIDQCKEYGERLNGGAARKCQT